MFKINPPDITNKTTITPEYWNNVKEEHDHPGDFLYLDEDQLLFYQGASRAEQTEVCEESEVQAKSICIPMPTLEKFKKYRNVYCVNCGEKGHVVRDCDGPITSFGILAFKHVENNIQERWDINQKLKQILDGYKKEIERDCSQQNSDVYPKVKFLMIQRKDTMGYIDFIRGKYPDNNFAAKQRLIQVCLHEMIPEEKHNLLTKTFDELWSGLWVNKNSKTFKNEYAQSRAKFEKLDIQELVSDKESSYTHTEFGFAKGRRNMRESNIACAEREFFEETGYTKEHYEFIKYYPTIQEEFIGTNGIRYRHIYYLVKMKNNAPPPKVDTGNILQTGEVQNLGWFTFEEASAIIRPYDTAKRRVIEKVHKDILNMNGQYVCSNFYYNTKRNNYQFSSSPVHDYSVSDYWRSHSI